MFWEFLLHYLWIDRDNEERTLLAGIASFLLLFIGLWIGTGSLAVALIGGIVLTIFLGVIALLCYALFRFYRHLDSEYQDFLWKNKDTQ